MEWLIPRILSSLLWVLLTGSAGLWLGNLYGVPGVGSLIGAALGVLLHSVVDAVRAERLVQWLRGKQVNSAPRAGEFWGEVGYRVERSVRRLERSVIDENEKLAQFLSAIEASPNGVMMLDASDQIEWCNSEAADHFGLDRQRDKRQRVTNLVRAPAFVAYLQRGAFEEAVVFPGPGSRGSVSVLVRRYGKGMKLVLSQDVTERERNDAMRRDFVANVSHEIRTPLTVLSGFIETMVNLQLSDAERRRVMELMAQQTVRMQSLVGDLLTLAQLEGSPRPAADRWVDVARLFSQVQADAQALSAGRHRLLFNAPVDVQLAGAEVELISAVANLVTNAVRYTPAGGSVTVNWLNRSDGSGEIDVQDDGPGIAREHLPRLTERFYRVDGSRSRDTGGTGLGLSIVKHVMLRHGGELEVMSEVGKGSTFKLQFPSSRVRAGIQASSLTARTSSQPEDATVLGAAATNAPATIEPHAPVLNASR
jgi:two-component system, OmpR family, phosphate regulon sensor histidine kinase PhoR